MDGPAFLVTADPGRRITFGELVATNSTWEVPEEAVPVKSRADFTPIGQPAARVDIPAKINGEAVYGYDIRLDGMKYGAVARPPTIEATMTSAAAGDAETMPGVHTVLATEDFAGVVADSPRSSAGRSRQHGRHLG